VVVHCTAEHAAPVHVKLVGVPVQFANKVTVVPIRGAVSLGMIEQLGIAGGGVPPPPPPPPPAAAIHSTVVFAIGPVPDALTPSTP